MLIMEIIQSSWAEQLLVGIDSIVLNDGTVYTIEIDSAKDIRANETFNRVYTFRVSEKTSLDALLKDDPDIWSEFQTYGEFKGIDNSKVLFGEGEMGNEGFVVKLDADNNLEWSLYSTESNPFIESRREDDGVHIFSSHGFSLVLNENNNPLGIFIDNHIE